jgi:conjugative transfer signal peptidase TraF
MLIRGRFADLGQRRWPAVKRIALGFACGLVVTVELFDLLGVRINTSPSLPLGLYVRTRDRESPLVEFCPAEPFARLAIVRGYRSAGSCRDGGAPLLKPVIAKAGDVVEVAPSGISVNGTVVPNTAPMTADASGRPLSPWPPGRYLVQSGTVWAASSFNPRSFDSRYFGPVPTNAIRDHLRPLIAGGK